MLYFDHNATTPLLPEARAAWLEAVEKFPGNPSSPHRIGGRAEAALHRARETLAAMLGCSPMEIVWTSGATESNNAVLHHFAGTASAGESVWISATEHPCVIEAARRYFPKHHRLIPVGRAGTIDLEWLETELDREPPALVGVMAANNETGVLQPWRGALQLCREHEVPFFCDAAQWLGKMPAAGLGECDFLSACAHKFGGPKGVGFFKCRAQTGFRPLLVGGPQEFKRRAGTENVAGVLSMLAALEARQRRIERGEERERLDWRKEFEESLLKALPGAEIGSRTEARLWNTVCALMPETNSRQRWVVKLDKAGFAVSTGSACASGKEAPSHVLAAMGYTAAEAGRVLRFSSGWETSRADWQSLIKGIIPVHQEINARGSNRIAAGRSRGTIQRK